MVLDTVAQVTTGGVPVIMDLASDVVNTPHALLFNKLKWRSEIGVCEAKEEGKNKDKMNTGINKSAGARLKRLYQFFAKRPEILSSSEYNKPYRFQQAPSLDHDKLGMFSSSTVAPSVRYMDLSVPIAQRQAVALAQLRSAQKSARTQRLAGWFGFSPKINKPTITLNRTTPKTAREQAEGYLNQLEDKLSRFNYNDYINLDALFASNDLRRGYSYRRRWSPWIPHFIRAQAREPFVVGQDWTNPDIIRAANQAAKTAPKNAEFIYISDLLPNLKTSTRTKGLQAKTVADTQRDQGDKLKILRPGQPHVPGVTTRNRHVYETMDDANNSNLMDERIFMRDAAHVRQAMRDLGIDDSDIVPVPGKTLWGDQGTLFRGSTKDSLRAEIPENLYPKAEAKVVRDEIDKIHDIVGSLPPTLDHEYIDWRWLTPSSRRAIEQYSGSGRQFDNFLEVPREVYDLLATRAPRNAYLPTAGDFTKLRKDLHAIFNENKLPGPAWQKV